MPAQLWQQVHPAAGRAAGCRCSSDVARVCARMRAVATRQRQLRDHHSQLLECHERGGRGCDGGRCSCRPQQLLRSPACSGCAHQLTHEIRAGCVRSARRQLPHTLALSTYSARDAPLAGPARDLVTGNFYAAGECNLAQQQTSGPANSAWSGAALLPRPAIHLAERGPHCQLCCALKPAGSGLTTLGSKWISKATLEGSMSSMVYWGKKQAAKHTKVAVTGALWRRAAGGGKGLGGGGGQAAHWAATAIAAASKACHHPAVPTPGHSPSIFSTSTFPPRPTLPVHPIPSPAQASSIPKSTCSTA
jgi:hypothetical protein